MNKLDKVLQKAKKNMKMNKIEKALVFLKQNGKITHRDIILVTNSNCPYTVLRQMKNYVELEEQEKKKYNKSGKVECIYKEYSIKKV